MFDSIEPQKNKILPIVDPVMDMGPEIAVNFDLEHKYQCHTFQVPDMNGFINISFTAPKSYIPLLRAHRDLLKKFVHEITDIYTDPYNPSKSADPDRRVSDITNELCINEEAKVRRTLHLLSPAFSECMKTPVLIKGNSQHYLKEYVSWETYEDLHAQFDNMLKINKQIETNENQIIKDHFAPLELYGLFTVHVPPIKKDEQKVDLDVDQWEAMFNYDDTRSKYDFMTMEYLDPQDGRKHIESLFLRRVLSRGGVREMVGFRSQEHPILAEIANKYKYSGTNDSYTNEELMDGLRRLGVRVTDLKGANILYRDFPDGRRTYKFIDQRPGEYY